MHVWRVFAFEAQGELTWLEAWERRVNSLGHSIHVIAHSGQSSSNEAPSIHRTGGKHRPTADEKQRIPGSSKSSFCLDVGQSPELHKRDVVTPLVRVIRKSAKHSGLKQNTWTKLEGEPVPRQHKNGIMCELHVVTGSVV